MKIRSRQFPGRPGAISITTAAPACSGSGTAFSPGQRGFTLVEILVAVALLAATSVSLCAAFSSGFTIAGSARENLRATQIMMRKIEDVRLCTWSQLADVTFVERYNPAGATSNTGDLHLEFEHPKRHIR